MSSNDYFKRLLERINSSHTGTDIFTIGMLADNIAKALLCILDELDEVNKKLKEIKDKDNEHIRSEGKMNNDRT